MQKKAISFPKLTILLQLWLVLAVMTAEAVPARRGLITVRQSDGTTLRVRIYGDEFYHYTVSEEGYTLVEGPKGDYYFARLGANGQLESTGVLARPMNRLSAAERQRLGADVRKGIRPAGPTPQQQRMKQQMRQASRSVTRAADGLPEPPKGIGSAGFPTIGDAKGIVLLAEFADLPFTKGTVDEFDKLLNGRDYTQDGATGSAWQYYYDNSNGRFDPDFVIVGPYTLPHDRSYYTPEENGELDLMGSAWKMIVDVCQIAYDNGVDFTPFADDGKLRDVFVFYAGGNSADGSDASAIWPHRWDVSYVSSVSLGGVKLAGYACGSELATGADGLPCFTPIGTFCHEFGHVLGWPDFYDTDYEENGDALGPNCFSLMANGSYNNNSRTPPALSLLERWMVGWAEPELVNAVADYRMEPVTQDHGYLLNTRTTNEYFLMEYRGAGLTVWDNPDYYSEYEKTSYSGMVVYHVDYTAPNKWDWYNNLNADASHECYKLVCSVPDADYAEWYSSTTFFPGGSNITSLLPTENAGFMAWNGTLPPYSLTNIALVAGECVTFSTVTNGLTGYEILPFQRDALLKWTDNASSRWTVSWKKVGDATASTRPVSQQSILLSGLTPGESYEVDLSNQLGESLSFTFDTQAEQADGLPRMGLYRNTEEGSVVFYLSDAAGSGTVQSVRTLVDGAAVPSAYLSLSAGTHTVRIEITRTDGTVEYLLKEVTVGGE